MRGRNVLGAFTAIVLVIVALLLIRQQASDDEEAPETVATATPATTTLPLALTTTIATTTTAVTTLPTTIAMSSTTVRNRVDLVSAIDSGMVGYRAVGANLESVRLSLTAQVALDLVIDVGTLFVAEGAGVQNMVVRSREVVTLRPEVEIEVELDAACANMYLDTPYADDSFSVQSGHSPELTALLEVPAFTSHSFRVQQFAIWTITDDPAPGGYVGLGTGPGGAGPTDGELAEIRNLFLAAGLDPGAYPGLV